MAPSSKPRIDMRSTMPAVTEQVAQWRSQYGAEYVNECIKRSMRGEPGLFFAMEAGHTIGTPARATDVPSFSVQGYALLLGGDGAAFIRVPAQEATHGTN